MVFKKGHSLINGGRTTHGMKGTRIYNIWLSMRQRCNNVNHPRYKDYGNRNIKVCPDWNNNFLSFYNWAILNKYNDSLTIERKNNNKGYNPDNCKWATYKEQNNNRRDRINQKWFKAIRIIDNYIEISNNQHEFARKYNLQQSNMAHCLKKKCKTVKGWTFEYI